MKKIINHTARFGAVLTLSIVGLFVFAHTAFAGTLTNFSYSADTYEAGATANYTFNYTLETANPSIIIYTAWQNGFDLLGSSVSVLVNGIPAPIAVNDGYWNGGGGGAAYVRLLDTTVPAGANISVTFSNVVNPSTPGTYSFGWVKTADGGGNTVDSPESIDLISITVPDVPFTGTGSGTDLDPYVITTCSQLQEMKNHLSAVYTLGNTIDCSETATWNSNVDEWVDGVVGGELIPDSYTIVQNNGYKGFEPIGDNDNPFTGKLNGSGYRINNLWIFRKGTPFIGLFGFINGATIQNLTLDSAQIVGASNTGGFIGYMQSGTISGVTNTEGSVRAYLSYSGGGIVGYMENGSIASADVNGGAVHGSGNIIGGVVGYMDNGTITDSSTSADIDGGEYIGGFVGQMLGGSITDSVATGDVVSNSSENTYVYIVKTGQYSGGFVGRMTGGVITDSYATGSVTAESSFAGGFAGVIENASGILHDIYATGAVTGSAAVGGFAGIINGVQIQDAYATGTVNSVGDNIGGFVGQSSCGAIFTRTYATGNVTGGNNTGGFSGADGCEGPGSTFIQSYASGNVTGNMSVGGFLGQTYASTVTNAYASGNVEGSMKAGGFAGEVFGGEYTNAYSRGHVQAGTNFNAFIGETPYIEWLSTITNSFYDNDTASAGSANGGTGKTTAEMKTQSTFTDASWDFDDIWGINETDNNGYPFFRYQNFVSGPTLNLVLTEVTPIPSQSTVSNAIYRFSVSSDIDTAIQNETGNYVVEQVTCSNCEVHIDPVSHTLYFSGLQVGDILDFGFAFQVGEQASNSLHVGPTTIVSDPVSSQNTIVTTSGSIPKNMSSAGGVVKQDPISCSIYGLVGPGTVKFKSKGANTKGVQQAINQLQVGVTVSTDGIAGLKTISGMKLAQKKINVIVDGIWGVKTQAAYMSWIAQNCKK